MFLQVGARLLAVDMAFESKDVLFFERVLIAAQYPVLALVWKDGGCRYCVSQLYMQVLLFFRSYIVSVPGALPSDTCSKSEK